MKMLSKLLLCTLIITAVSYSMDKTLENQTAEMMWDSIKIHCKDGKCVLIKNKTIDREERKCIEDLNENTPIVIHNEHNNITVTSGKEHKNKEMKTLINSGVIDPGYMTYAHIRSCSLPGSSSTDFYLLQSSNTKNNTCDNYENFVKEYNENILAQEEKNQLKTILAQEEKNQYYTKLFAGGTVLYMIVQLITWSSSNKPKQEIKYWK